MKKDEDDLLCIEELLVRDCSYSTFANFSEKRAFLTPLIRTPACAYQEVRNARFSEKFAYVLNGWSLMVQNKA